ncbi:MAG: hypothetical protein H0U60_13265 [Blastocatellia bacterium]|nr:hypothetical protein [Blastocatellia bacterium]
MSTPCKSGKHHWTDPEAAAKCCNGWRRVLLVGAEALAKADRPRVQDGTWIGFCWERSIDRESAPSQPVQRHPEQADDHGGEQDQPNRDEHSSASTG